MTSREQFDALRTRYLRASDALAAREIALAAKYGLSCQPAWYSAAERKRLSILRERADKAGDAFTDHLATISPRDWSYGVPVLWIYGKLTYEDAVRPLNEPLSVSPPLPYGATRAMR